VLGRSFSNLAGDCPYTVDDMPLRTAWLDGFSAGRVGLNASQPDGSFRKKDSPEAQAEKPPAVEGR
jgi:hypothetical protein